MSVRIGALILIMFVTGLGMATDSSNRSLSCSLAGQWYPAEPNALRAQLQGFLDKADVQPRRDVIALIQPHAGYAYSGPTAAKGLALAGRSYKRIIVIGPSHRFPVGNRLVAPRAGSFRTPLGQIPIDTDVVERLLQHAVFQDLPRAFQGENSVEMQLPLLQMRQQDFKLVPILVGACSWDVIRSAAMILRTCVDADTLVVASSDFTHYGPNFGYVPFTEDVPKGLKDLDMGAFRFIEAMDAKGFLGYQRQTEATICGHVAVAILLAMADTSCKPHVVDYTTSGQVTGDYTNSVSYLSVAFTGKWSAAGKDVETLVEATLSDQDKKALLALARKTIVHYIENRKIPGPADLGIRITEAMEVPRAAFVTLKKQDRLRGCIGEVLPSQALYKSVISNAIHAAVHDGRFRPVTASECNALVIEISALTVPKSVKTAAEIRLGVDGIILRKAGQSALFLPQVAPEQGWTLEQTLEQLSQKAGLPAHAWKEGASFEVFQAEVFGEQ